ncbi:MAG: hypothetical protein P8X57_02635 [Cyclobacteriaceae bacterium]
MDASNRTNIHALDPQGRHREKVILMRYFDPHNREADVPDPYFGGEDGFQHVFEILERSTENLLDWLVERHGLES